MTRAALQSAPVKRFLLVPCEAPGCEDLTIVWDRQEEQVIDVMSRAEVEAYALNDGAL